MYNHNQNHQLPHLIHFIGSAKTTGLTINIVISNGQPPQYRNQIIICNVSTYCFCMQPRSFDRFLLLNESFCKRRYCSSDDNFFWCILRKVWTFIKIVLAPKMQLLLQKFTSTSWRNLSTFLQRNTRKFAKQIMCFIYFVFHCVTRGSKGEWGAIWNVLCFTVGQKDFGKLTLRKL